MDPAKSKARGSAALDGRKPDLARPVPPGPSVGARVWHALRGRLEAAHERRRMGRAARQPEELTARIGQARTILFVCHGNLIRSPFGAALLRARLGDRRGVAVQSSGLWAATGHLADKTAIQCAGRFGVDLTGHRTHPLERRDVEMADVLFVMEIRHLLELRRRFPWAYARTYLLGCLTPQRTLEVADPASQPLVRFEECYGQIEAGVDRIVASLLSVPAPLACGPKT